MDMSDEELDQAVKEFGSRAKRVGSARQIRQVHVASSGHFLIIYALCNDGTLWSRAPFSAMEVDRHWDRVEDIPLDP